MEMKGKKDYIASVAIIRGGASDGPEDDPELEAADGAESEIEIENGTDEASTEAVE